VELSNSELASELFAAFNRRDLDGALAIVHDEVEFIAPTADMANDGRPYRGHAGMEKYYADAARVWIELEVMPREYREVGDDAVLVLGRVWGRGEGGYIQDSPTQWVMRVKDGRIRWIRVFTNRSAALAEVGLEDQG
jgi:ketosteroid isomerase-like protein